MMPKNDEKERAEAQAEREAAAAAGNTETVSETTGREQDEALEVVEDDERFTEGQAAQVRDASAVNKMPGHMGTVQQWEASEAGERFKEVIAPAREKVIAKQAKQFEEQSKRDEELVKANQKAADGVAKAAAEDRKKAEQEASNDDGNSRS